MTCILCKVCFYLGDGLSWLINFIPDSWERIGLAAVRLYQQLMQWSIVLNDRADCDVWGPELEPRVNLPSQLNRYTCQSCGGVIITIDRDEGVTPFMLACRAKPGCKGEMYSSFYRDVKGEPTFEWRKPTPDEYAKASPFMQQHFEMGGLDIYPILRRRR
jgi:hypothetical protein